MLKKSITYEDFDGNTVTEDFYFHISKSELAEMELSKKGGMEQWLKTIIASEDGGTLIAEFKKLILSAYGQKSEDGRRFRKSETLREDFLASPAFDVLFMELVTDAQRAAQFVNGVVPSALQQDVQNVFDTPQPEDSGPEMVSPERVDPTALTGHPSDVAASQAPKVDAEGRRILTRIEVVEMPDTELRHLLATGQAVLGEG